MSGAIFRIMLLGLLRDRGALAMSFVVPAAFFVIFSAVVSGLGGETLALRVVVVDETDSEAANRLLQHLSAGPEGLTAQALEAGPDALRERVRTGSADVGLILEASDAAPLPEGAEALPRARIVSDPARAIATLILSNQLQRAYLALLSSEGTLGGAPAEDTGSAPPAASSVDTGAAFAGLVIQEEVAGQGSGTDHIAYYAGAAAVLFLLFSTVHGAVSLLEEKESGILERLVLGPGSTTVLVNGKFLYLVLQGFVQVGVIFLVAWLAYGVDIPGNFLAWSVTTLAAAGAAAGLALALATACATRRQAQAIANVSILVLSALGGSMVPRFLMPAWLQDLGWLTPNTWALEAYVTIFWREESWAQLLLPWGLLVGAATLGLISAQLMARRMESL